MVDPGATVRERETQFVLSTVSGRLHELTFDARHELTKGILFIFGVLSTVVGVILVMVGLHLTDVFRNLPVSIPAVICGGVCFLPILFWFVWVYCYPLLWSSERQRRKQIHELRKDRKKPTLFNDMVSAAQEHAKPPVKMMRVKACFRDRYYALQASDLRDFCSKVEFETGLPSHQQLVKYKGIEIFDPDLRLDDGYHVAPNDVVHVFNKGGFLTPLRSKDGFLHPDLERGILLPRADVIKQQKEEEEEAMRFEKQMRIAAEEAEMDRVIALSQASFIDMFIPKKTKNSFGRKSSAMETMGNRKNSIGSVGGSSSQAGVDNSDNHSVASGNVTVTTMKDFYVGRNSSASVATSKVRPLEPWEEQFVPKRVDILKETSDSHARSLVIAGTFHSSPQVPSKMFSSNSSVGTMKTKSKPSP